MSCVYRLATWSSFLVMEVSYVEVQPWMVAFLGDAVVRKE